VPVPDVEAFAPLVDVPFAPALADPPPPPPFELPLDVLEALAEPEGPDEDALEWLPLLLDADPPAKVVSLKATRVSKAADVTSDSLVIEILFMIKTPLFVPLAGTRMNFGQIV
jgi:hypothetical protein